MKNYKTNKKSTTEENLKSIETRLKNLYKLCPKKKRKKFLKPILTYTEKKVCRNQKPKLLILSVFVAISAFIMLDPDMFYIRATTKKSFIWVRASYIILLKMNSKLFFFSFFLGTHNRALFKK